MRTLQEIDHAFSYHPPRNQAEIDFYGLFRDRVRQLAMALYRELRDCPERTIALRHLEQAVMYGNAAVARNGLEGVPFEPMVPPPGLDLTIEPGV